MKQFLKKILATVVSLASTASFVGCELLDGFEGLSSELSSSVVVSEGSSSSESASSNTSNESSENEGSSSTSSSVLESSESSISSSDSSNDSSDDTPDAESSSSESSSSSSSPSDSSSNSSNGSSSGAPDVTPDDMPDEIYDTISIHFLEIGNQYTGDCTYIKAGDTDILIDAGSRKGSATTIASYVNKYCTDGKLEYVIATHADQDHIAGFVGENGKGIFDVYRIGTLIDFPLSDKTTQISKDYKSKRSSIVSQYGTNHITALEWWKEEKGFTRSIEIADGVTMNVLYQKYYETSTSDENNYSVCVMFSQGDNHFLFTGDLEVPGEASLVASNNLPKVKLFKAGHHGSYTATTAALMRVVQPEIVCVCCCAGSTEYNAAPLNTFPTQTFINNVAPYTDKIYVTTLGVAGSDGKTTGFTSMNGDIVVTSTGENVTVNCSNNNTILKNTAWFKANRTWPSNGV